MKNILLLLLTAVNLSATIEPATPNQIPPPDALVLFDGTKLDAWINLPDGPTPTQWTIEHGTLTSHPGGGSLATRQAFADCQLHFESLGSPASAVFFQGRYSLPSANTTIPSASDWQSYDITYRAARFNNDGSVKSPAVITVLRDGVLRCDRVALTVSPAGQDNPHYEKHAFKQPLVLQAPAHPLCLRNIWIRELGVQHLLNRKDTTGWYSYLEKLGKNNDPEGNFKVTDGLLHIEGKNFGYLATEQSFANYYLKVVFKWGQHQYAPRATGKRDSGILYHFASTEPDKVWPRSLECQVQEGDCGDTWCVDGASVESPNRSAIEWNMKRIYRSADFENPAGEWNTIEIICNGDQTEHYVNGHLVNSGTKANVTSGKILLQSEGAEIYYRSVELISY